MPSFCLVSTPLGPAIISDETSQAMLDAYLIQYLDILVIGTARHGAIVMPLSDYMSSQVPGAFTDSPPQTSIIRSTSLLQLQPHSSQLRLGLAREGKPKHPHGAWGAHITARRCARLERRRRIKAPHSSKRPFSEAKHLDSRGILDILPTVKSLVLPLPKITAYFLSTLIRSTASPPSLRPRPAASLLCRGSLA